MIPVLGFATLKRFDLADRLLASIDYPVENLVIVDNSGTASWNPIKPDWVVNMWVLRVPFGLGLVGAWNLIIKSTPYAPYWFLVNDDAWFPAKTLEIAAKEIQSDSINFFDCQPKWSAVAFGEECIDKVGLYDEAFYPLYYDDDDYERRVDYHKVNKNTINARVYHENSSTLAAGYQKFNNHSFGANKEHLDKKVASDDYSQGGWTLATRRANRWD